MSHKITPEEELEPRAIERMNAMITKYGEASIGEGREQSILSHSSALSLKRIADALERLAAAHDIFLDDQREEIMKSFGSIDQSIDNIQSNLAK